MSARVLRDAPVALASRRTRSSVLVGAAVAGSLLQGACSTSDNYLGFDRLSVSDPTGPSATPFPTPTETTPTVSPTAMDPRDGGEQPSLPPLPASPTTDAGPPSDDPPIDPSPATMDASVDDGEAGPIDPGPLTPLQAKTDLPNLYVEVLGLTEAEVDERISADFEQLFYGDADLEAVYFEVGEDAAYIYDTNYEDTRIDALGYGMMISVLLDHRIEFDKIWNYAYTYLLHKEGSLKGYFHERCDVSGSPCSEETAVYGAFYLATALLMAEGRWGNGTGIYDYGAEARYQLDVMLNKETLNGGIVDDVTNMFDEETFMPYERPSVGYEDVCYPGAVVTPFWEYWGATTKNSFWTAAANRSRAFFNRVPHPVTGLVPLRAHHDGVPVDGERVFNHVSYGVGLHLALDHAWYGVEESQVGVADNLVNFFANFPVQPYPSTFSTAGEALDAFPSGALIAINGATAGISTAPAREQFIRRVWDRPLAEGTFRYFDGIQQLLAHLYLSGKFRVYSAER